MRLPCRGAMGQGGVAGEERVEKKPGKSGLLEYPLGESNPCPLAENQISWATRRRGLRNLSAREPNTTANAAKVKNGQGKTGTPLYPRKPTAPPWGISKPNAQRKPFLAPDEIPHGHQSTQHAFYLCSSDLNLWPILISESAE